MTHLDMILITLAGFSAITGWTKYFILRANYRNLYRITEALQKQYKMIAERYYYQDDQPLKPKTWLIFAGVAVIASAIIAWAYNEDKD